MSQQPSDCRVGSQMQLRKIFDSFLQLVGQAAGTVEGTKAQYA
jgi:hypothetical protein